jgi:hypothetical protein
MIDKIKPTSIIPINVIGELQIQERDVICVLEQEYDMFYISVGVFINKNKVELRNKVVSFLEFIGDAKLIFKVNYANSNDSTKIDVFSSETETFIIRYLFK